MKTSDFRFDLPHGFIAQSPPKDRGDSRLMAVYKDGNIRDLRFPEIIDLLDNGDLIILNDTKVTPVRLTGVTEGNKELEILIVNRIEGNRYRILSKGGYSGRLVISDEMYGEVTNGDSITLHHERPFDEVVWERGMMPLPPYITRQPDETDKERYQTVYAKKTGSIAAPTAGIHFTNRVLDTLKGKGVIIRQITHHVGIGTFRPIRCDNIEAHKMETEDFEIPADIPALINIVREKRKRVVYTGTTTTRAMESLLSDNFTITSTEDGKICGSTEMFITPGYDFIGPTAILTNLHLPASTPLLLACAFGGTDVILNAYKEAMRLGYRFFSYGDAMIIL